MAPAILLSVLALLLPPHASANANSSQKIGIIEHIVDGTSVAVQRGESNLTLRRGEELLDGDALTTSGQTVYIQLARHNELQITPHSEIVLEHIGIGKSDEDSSSSFINVKKGILWGLIANGVSLATPFTVRTNELIVDVAGANLIIERSEHAKSTTVLSLEGTLKYGLDPNEMRLSKSARYVNAGFRISSQDGKITAPKRFKRHLLIFYLNKKARATSKDMSNRGFRALSAIIRKDAADSTEEQITWNLPPGVGTPQGRSGGSGSSGGGPPSPGSGSYPQ